MITKGNQRAGGQQLATHLLNEFDNDYVEVFDVRGTVSQDLHGAFAEWQCASEGTQCTKYLYSLSINPWLDVNGPLSRDQYLEFIERTEKRMELTGQPRAIVFHVKEGREHCHVAWSRIDVEKMKAVQLSFDHNDLRTLVQEFAKDHNLELPEGLKKNNRDDRFENKDKQPDLDEKQRQDRTGITKAQHIAVITSIWQGSDSAKAFYQGLKSAGYTLCQGDKDRYLLLDQFGENLRSLPNMIDVSGVNKKKLDAFLGKTYPVDKLPTLEKARKLLAVQKETKRSEVLEEFKIASDQMAHDLKQIQAKRQKKLDNELSVIKQRQRKEREALKAIHQVKDRPSLLKRILRQPPGLAATLLRVTGIHAMARFADDKLKQRREQSKNQDRKALNERHKSELTDFQRRQQANELVNKKENSSLRSKLRRLERERIYQTEDEKQLSRAEKLEIKRKRKLEAQRKSQKEQDRDNERGGK
jgi:hypothetical protein